MEQLTGSLSENQQALDTLLVHLLAYTFTTGSSPPVGRLFTGS